MTGAPAGNGTLVVWRFSDGQRGHDNQSEGLVRALARRAPLSEFVVGAPRAGRVRAAWRVYRGDNTGSLPDPDLLVGAGHATHLPMLAARRARGGRAVVLMRPSLPRRWFDLLVVPEHDGLAPGPGVLVTRGALNAVRPAETKDARAGLILVGGPSRHHGWAGDELVEQIDCVVRRHRDVAWTAATSPRTPGDFARRLEALGAANLRVVPYDAVGPEWLPERLADARVVWVTEDSVSMVYESLSAGAATGLLRMPRRRPGGSRTSERALARLDTLLADSLVTSFDAWHSGHALTPPRQPLDEAGRCADWIIDEWLAGRA